MSVTVPVVNQFAHPPLALVNGITFLGNYSGSGVISSPTLAGFGIVYALQGVGPGFGYELGYLNKYESRLAQLVVEWDIGVTGSTQYQVEEAWYDRGQFWFSDQLPARMHYYMAPSVSLDLYKLLLA